MRNILAGAALAVLAATAVSADPGGGHGGGNGGGNGNGGGHGGGGFAMGDPGGGGGKHGNGGGGNGNGGGKHGGDEGPGNSQGHGNKDRGNGGGGMALGGDHGRGHERKADKGENRGRGAGNGERMAGSPGNAWRGENRDTGRDNARGWDNGAGRRDDGNVTRVAYPVFSRFDGERGVIDGCPPGLAKKHNGCMPPGLARERDAYRPDWFGLSGSRGDGYRYADGYLLRYGADRVLGYVPLLGGALFPGNPWPSGFDTPPLNDYYRNYYDLGQSNESRYYDGTVYRVDPGTSAITGIAALLTGQRFDVGQALPQGYSVYNVPYEYRDRYADTAESQYRYNDGYLYQVDPKTQLIAAVIQLLT